MFTDTADMDAKKVAVWVFFGSHGGYHKYVDERNERHECPISLIPVSTKTNWEALDNLVFTAFKVSEIFLLLGYVLVFMPLSHEYCQHLVNEQ